MPTLTSPILDGEAITESSLISLRSMPEEEAAVVLDRRMEYLENVWKTSFVERGLIMLEFEERLLWQYIDDPLTGVAFKSKEAWIQRKCPQSRSDCFAALRAVKELKDVPVSQLREVPRCNVAVLQSLSTKVRQQPEVLEAAKTMTERQFVEKIEKDHPTQHMETRKVIRLTPTASAYKIIEQAFNRAMEVEGCASKEQVLEEWAVEALERYKSLSEDDIDF